MDNEEKTDLLREAIHDITNIFSGEENTETLFEYVRNILPIKEENYKILSVKGTARTFKANIKAKLQSEEDVAKFIENYGLKNNETLRIAKTRKGCSDGESVLTKYFRCHHNTRYEGTKCPSEILLSRPSKRFKNTNCPFSLVIRISKKDMQEFGSTIDIEWNHNHSVQSLHSLSFKDIPTSVKNDIKQMFESGLLPGAAHREFLRQLRSQCKDELEYHQQLADRSKAPRRKDFNDIYSLFKKDRFGTGSMSDMFSALEERIECLQKKDQEYTIKYQKFNEEVDQPFVLAIVTPLMKRVHKLVPQCKDLAFIDSSSNMEEYNLRVFVIVTHSVCGALPLGIFITSDEKEQTLKDALELIKSCFGDSAFYGRNGPRVFMTDNCSELREALKEVWPNSVLLLCIFHVLQQVWRWLHEKKNGIAMEDRPALLLLFKEILYAESEDKLQDSFDNLISSDVASKYVNFKKYATDVFEDREAWALCYRDELPIRGNNTNNLCEAQFLVIKDEVLNRQKEVNVVGLIDKFISDLDEHYRNKILSVSSGKFDGIYSRRFQGRGKSAGGIGFQIPNDEEQKLAVEKTIKVDENMFLVPSFTTQGTQYLVDMNTGICQCKIGMNGSPCKHQYILWAHKLADAINFLPVFSKEQRQLYAQIAIGMSLPLEYYEGLHDQVLSLPDPVEQSSDVYHCADERDVVGTPPPRRDISQDMITVEECSAALTETLDILQGKLRGDDQNFLKGVLKFTDRVKNMSKSKLTTALHSFGARGVYNTHLTTTSVVKKRKRGKIHVQPEAVKRRKNITGSKRRQNKGQTVRNNPFEKQAGRAKRAHKFAENVRQNEPVAKKAGRNMATKTRVYEH